MAKPQSLDVLIQEKELSAEAVQRLKDAWISNCDELYSRMKACVFSQKPEIVQGMEKELGIKQGSLNEFMKYVERYVSPEVVKAEKPKQYPINGYPIGPRTR